jgi:hypothetical protein
MKLRDLHFSNLYHVPHKPDTPSRAQAISGERLSKPGIFLLVRKFSGKMTPSSVGGAKFRGNLRSRLARKGP